MKKHASEGAVHFTIYMKCINIYSFHYTSFILIYSLYIHFSILGYIDSKVCIYRYRESKNLKKLIGMRITKLSWQAPPGMGGEGDVESGYQPHQSYFIFQTSDE